MEVDRFAMEFNGKEYDAVEIDGSCVDLDKIILAECALNVAITDAIENHSNCVDLADNAECVDNLIFGFADKDLILNGSEDELAEYAQSLL